MNCPEARGLLEQGVTPGSSPPKRAALGFHLTGCPDCRAFRANLDDYLLSSLLSGATPALPEARDRATAARPAPRPSPDSTGRSWRASLSQALWYGGLGLLAAFVVGIAIVVGGAALSIFHIHRNVQAMIVPTVHAEVAPPTAAAPAATLAPTPTLAPTLTLAPTQAPATPTLPKPSATPLPTLPPPTAIPAAPPDGGAVTVLLLGSDQRPGETGPPRTDALIVARIDPRSHRVALLSLPRDLWVEIPGYGHARINAAHVWGIIYKDPEGGLGLARKTVSNLLGIPIDYTVYIDFEGFIGAIDSLGGITVHVEKELYDAKFPTMDYGYTVAHFLPGPRQMDGETALTYSRIRHPDSDFARMRRQQAVLVAIMDHLRQQNTLQSLQSLEAVTAALRDYVKTDMPEERMIGLAWALRDAAPDQVERYVVDENSVSFGIGDDRWAEVASPGTFESLAQQLLGR
jgi:polyisoprenyl-teichoic acid--peptidoglycan teichoic acid transferase